MMMMMMMASQSPPPRSLFHQAAVAAFRHGGDDLAVLGFPFEAALVGSRLKERPLPLVTYDESLLLLASADVEDVGLDLALCRFVDSVGPDVDMRGLIAEIKEDHMDCTIPLARGVFSIDPSSTSDVAGGVVVVVSPGTWHDSPCRSNVRGAKGWLRSFRRSERLAHEVWQRLGRDMAPNEMLLTRTFQHLFREAVVSRHGAALQSALALYERALALLMKSDRTCVLPLSESDALDNLWTSPPAGGDDYDVADRSDFAGWSVGYDSNASFFKRTLFAPTTGRDLNRPFYGNVLAAAGHWLMQDAVCQEDPLALVAMEAVLSRKHAAFAASPLKRERHHFGQVDGDLFEEMARSIGHPCVGLVHLEKAWLVAQAMPWFAHPLRDSMWNVNKLPYQMLCDADARREQDYYESLDPCKDSLRLNWHERQRANFAAFATRPGEQKAQFYDRLDAWLSDELLDFLDEASDHLRAANADSAVELRALKDFVERLVATLANMLDVLVASVGLPVGVMIRYASTVSANMVDEASPLRQMIRWLGVPEGRDMLASRHPLVAPFARSSAYTLERQARLCFRLIGARSLYAKAGAKYNMGCMALAYPEMALDPRNQRAMGHISRGSDLISLRAGFCMQFNRKCGSVSPGANERLWRDTILPAITRDFMRHAFLASDADPCLASRIDFRMSPHEDCDAKLREALRSFAFGGCDDFHLLLNTVSRSPALCKCQAIDAL
ncbi:hypothetical protein [Mollivirus kamchatka]|nr:hypothetical protein [Mollivirus kamchatka]